MIIPALPQWYAVYTKARREDRAQQSLNHRGLETLFPRLLMDTLVSAERTVVPLFPRYLFVKLATPEHYYLARWSPGVHSIVAVAGVPSPVQDGAVEFLRQRANSEGLIVTRPQLVFGQEVTVAEGPFAGLTAIIQTPPDAKGRVRVLMTLLNRQVRVAMATAQIESPWVVGT